MSRGSPIRASFLVGADGANGVVAKAAGLGEGIVCGVALEGNVPWGALERGPYARTAWVELGIVPGGYGWVFPKGDHVNLGVGGWMTEGPNCEGTSTAWRESTGSTRRRSRASAAIACPCANSARPRHAVTCCSSATPRVSSTRSRATGCTRHSSPRKLSPQTFSTAARDLRGGALGRARSPRCGVLEGEARGRSVSARVFVGAARAGVFDAISGLLRGDSHTRARRAGSPVRLFVSCRGSRATRHARRDLKSVPARADARAVHGGAAVPRARWRVPAPST